MSALLVLGLCSALLGAPDRARVVVLDPGHGGPKLGAKNGDGVHEKGITLEVVKHAKKALEARGIEVIVTRDSDKDVSLSARVELANKSEAAVFVSVHANWSPAPARLGVETYILSPDASDNEAAATVHLENTEEEEGGIALPDSGKDKGGDLGFIVGDLERMTAHQDSAALAKLLQERVSEVRALGPSRGLRQAPFLVLRGAKMPAALVELGYLSHPKQGGYLASPGVEKAAGEAIATAVAKFLEKKGR
ncbi:MAG: N-acetylmuramoyl-L-alanine amidase [Myxococcota bacterium]